MKIKNLLIIFALTFSVSVSAKIEYKTVTVSGEGISKGEAVENALIEAISQINGVEVNSQTKSYFKAVSETKDNVTSDEYQKSLQKSIKKKTNGLVDSWRFISEVPPAAGDPYASWKVEIEVTISKYKVSKQAKRLRMATIPFRDNGTYKSNDFSKYFSENLNSYLTQTRKFAMIDRKFSKEVNSELNLLKSGNFKKQEAARLGNQLGTDYLVVGNIVDVKEDIKTIEALGKKISKKFIKVDLTFRIIDAATGLVKHSGDLKETFFNVDSLNDASKKAADLISINIINAIFPIAVIKVDGDELILGQGGDTIKSGDRYHLIKYGERVIDPYTKESLGFSEKKIGVVEILDVQSKKSTAKIVSLTVDQISQKDRMILRPASVQSKKAIKVKQMKKKIKEKLKKLDKDDDW